MRFLADENFNGKLLAALRTALPKIDVVRVQDTNMSASPDPELLEWAAAKNRIVLTHDVHTLAGFAYDRVRQGLLLPGIIEIKISQSIRATVDELVLLIEASTPQEFENQVHYIPLR